MSERDCIHGQLARSCGLCERDATIAALRAALAESIDAIKRWSAYAPYYVLERDDLTVTLLRFSALLEPPSGETSVPECGHCDDRKQCSNQHGICSRFGGLPHSNKTSAPVDIAKSNRELCENEGHVFGVPMRECFRCHAQFALAVGAGDAGLIAAASAQEQKK